MTSVIDEEINMDCPNCQIKMDHRETRSTLLDECPKCKGIWFDPGELDKIKDDIEPDLRWLDFDLWKWEGDFRVMVDLLDCPNCRDSKLRALHYDSGDVTVYYCPSCEGIWLQAGDFHKIVSALVKEAESKDVTDYITASVREALEMLKNPDNVISEWQDLKSVLRLLKYRFFVENPKVKSILVGLQKSLPL
jgi:Zn-finger nucleic acid-binding protein